MNNIFELFNWKITKFLAIKWLRAAYLITILAAIIMVGAYEWVIGNQSDASIGLRIAEGFGAFLGLMLLILYIRILIEFLISIFYIEDHLRAIAKRSDDFEIQH